MSYQPGQNLYSQNGGLYPENVEIPVIANRAPTSSDWMYPIGKRWDYLNNAEYILLGLSTSAGITTATWALSTKSTGVVAELTTSDSVIVHPDANGNINTLGTGSITTVGTTNTTTVELTGLTIHSVLVGAGTATITKLTVGTDGQVLTGNSAADPSFDAIGTKSGLTAHGVVLAEGTSAFVATGAGTNGEILIAASGADPAFGHLTPGAGIVVTEGANTLSVGLTSGGFIINPVAGTTGTFAAQNLYLCTNAGATTITLPATAAVGDTYAIVGSPANAGGWVIAPAGGQTIAQGASSSATSASSAGAANCAAQIMCTVANTDFVIMYTNGTLTYA